MEKLKTRKKLSIVKFFLSGLSYGEIAAKSGVGKGTVANVVAEFKQGGFPEAADVGDHIETLRELSLDLKRSNLSPGQCATGLLVLSRINELGLDLAHIDRWPMILKAVPNEDDAKEFVHLVYSIQEVLQRSGLSLEALDSKVHELEKKAADLRPIADRVKDCQKELTELDRQRNELTTSVAMLEQKRELLSPQVKDLERRERTLSRRVADVGPRAEKAEMTLAALKDETNKLNEVGFSLKQLGEFHKKLKVIAESHAIQLSELRSRLLDELSNLDKALTLEALINSRQQEADELKQDIARSENEMDATRAVVDSLTKEKMKLEADIKETRGKVSGEIAKIIPLAQDTIRRLGEGLQRGNEEALTEVRRLRDEAIEVGTEVGRYQGILESNEWLNELMTLLQGREAIEGKKVRMILLLVLRAFHEWLRQQHSYSLSFTPLSLTVDALIKELDAWAA